MKNFSFALTGPTCRVGVKGSIDAEDISTIKKKQKTLYRREKKDSLRASQKSRRLHLLLQRYKNVKLSFEERP